MYWTVHGRLNASYVYVSSKVQEKQSDCSRRPAEQSASYWSPSVGPWWRPAPPAACPAPPSVWRSVPQLPRCPAPLAAPPPAAEWPVGGGGAGAARPTNRVRQRGWTIITSCTLLHMKLCSQCGGSLKKKTASALYAQQGGISIRNGLRTLPVSDF